VRFLSGFFTFTGFLFLLGGAMHFFDSAGFLFKAQRTVGEVTSVEKHYIKSGNDGPVFNYRPTVRYQVSTGQTYSTAVRRSSSDYDFDIGKRIDVLYDPENPEHVRIKDFWATYVNSIGIAFTGLICLFLGGFLRPRRSSCRKRGQIKKHETG